MSRSVRVFAGVPVRRAVAAKRGSTCLADAQMNPICADLYAFFAFTALGLVDWEHVEIHENLPQVILRTRGADGSCGCTHDRGRFAIPGSVAVGTRSPINCIF